jgi:hypothetical protein
MMSIKKMDNLKEIYNFYKECSGGFVTQDGYAAVPFGKQLMIIYNGQQLKVCRTESSAHKFIKEHRSTPKQGTVFL